MASEIHVNDVGTQLIITIKDDGVVVDISAASLLQIILKKPDGKSYTKTGTFYTNGTDGKMTYTSIDGDFNVPGNYKIQGKVTLAGGTYYSSISDFQVYCNL
jgi:hypothetical protein